MKVDDKIPFAFIAQLFLGFLISLWALIYLYRPVKETLLLHYFPDKQRLEEAYVEIFQI